MSLTHAPFFTTPRAENPRSSSFSPPAHGASQRFSLSPPRHSSALLPSQYAHGQQTSVCTQWDTLALVVASWGYRLWRWVLPPSTHLHPARQLLASGNILSCPLQSFFQDCCKRLLIKVVLSMTCRAETYKASKARSLGIWVNSLLHLFFLPSYYEKT